MTRVLLVDDQALLRAGIATILRAQGLEVVGEVGDGREAVEAARRLKPDVICMDVQMPDMDGLEATRRIVAEPEVRSAVLMLTTFNREDYLLAALQAGASGFMLKNSRPEQLVEAIHAVAAGDALLAPEVTRAVISRAVATGQVVGAASAGVASSDGAASSDSTAPWAGAAGAAGSRGTAPAPSGDGAGGGAGALPAGGHVGVPQAGPLPAGTAQPGTAPSGSPAAVALATLTEREREVLEHVARGLSNDEIADRLILGRATVKTHVSNVLMKLGLRDRVQAVVFAYSHGVVAP